MLKHLFFFYIYYFKPCRSVRPRGRWSRQHRAESSSESERDREYCECAKDLSVGSKGCTTHLPSHIEDFIERSLVPYLLDSQLTWSGEVERMVAAKITEALEKSATTSPSSSSTSPSGLKTQAPTRIDSSLDTPTPKSAARTTSQWSIGHMLDSEVVIKKEEKGREGGERLYRRILF